MRWCPRCDEVFPQGPACPRCSTRLIERESFAVPDGLQSVPDAASLKLSRRYRRAFERLSGPRTPSSRVLVAAATCLVFAVGFLLGRVGSFNPDGSPTVRALPAAAPLAVDDIGGSAVYLLSSNDSLTTIAVHELYTGDVAPRGRITLPVDRSDGVSSHVVTLGRSVAVVVDDGTRSFVAFAPRGRPLHGWIPGVAAAWRTPDELLVREATGMVVGWSMSDDRVRGRRYAKVDRLFQTTSGAVWQQGRRLSTVELKRATLRTPPGRLLAVSSGAQRAIVDRAGPALWDGETLRRIRVEGFIPMAASFEGGVSPDRAALVLRGGDRLTLAVVDDRGNAALKPVGARARGCDPVPVWDANGRWIYVAPGDGVLYAVEAGGGRVQPVRTHGVGCGVAWIDES